MINLSAFTAGINRRAALCAATLGLYAAVVGAPVLAADAGNGKRVAVRCARPATSSLPTSVPFKEIADRPNFSEPGLVTFLLNPHAKMPNMSLTRIEANDIADYIRTLR
jgi:hypothetical protein